MLIIFSINYFFENNIVTAQDDYSTLLQGDVFYNTIEGTKIKADKNSILITPNEQLNIGTYGNVTSITNYNISGKLGWNEIVSKMDGNVSRLENQIITDDFKIEGGKIGKLKRQDNYYARELSHGNLNPYNVPEGQAWVINGDLTIDIKMRFSGKGTLIINGNLNVDRNMEYADNNSSIGFIVRSGNVNISRDADEIRGFFYVPDGKITVK